MYITGNDSMVFEVLHLTTLNFKELSRKPCVKRRWGVEST